MERSFIDKLIGVFKTVCEDEELRKALRQLSETMSKLTERSINQEKWIDQTLNEVKALREDVNQLFDEVDNLKVDTRIIESHWEQWAKLAGYGGMFVMSVTVVIVEFVLKV